MRKKWNLCFVWLACLWASTGISAEPFKLPQLPAPQLIDGMLSDPCWEKAYTTPDFILIDKAAKPTERTVAKLFTDKDNLYIGITCYFNEKDYDEKVADIQKRGNKSAFMVDNVELFIDPGMTGNLAHFSVNAGMKEFAVNKCASFQYAIQIQKDRWTIEFKIPFLSIKLGEEQFKPEWKLNVCRGNTTMYARNGGKELMEFSSWGDLRGGNGFAYWPGMPVVTGIKADLKALRSTQKQLSRKQIEVEIPRYFIDTQKSLTVKNTLKTDRSLKGCRLLTEIRNGTGKIVNKAEVKPVFFSNQFELPVDGMKETGRYYVSVALLDKDGKEIDGFTYTRSLWKVPPKTSRQTGLLTIRDQNFYRDGKFIFPIILWRSACVYTCPWEPKDASVEAFFKRQKAMLRDMHDTGIDFGLDAMYNYEDITQDIWDRYSGLWPWMGQMLQKNRKIGFTHERLSDMMKESGVGLIGMYPFIVNKISEDSIDIWYKLMLKYRDCDNIVFYKTTDETDTDIEGNKLRNQLYKEMDPDRLTWLNLINAPYQNRDAADIISTDPYPVPNSPLITVAANADRLTMTIEGRPNQSKMLWLQNFGGEGSWTRPPTKEELRVMTYLSLNHGIKGIGFFGWFSKTEKFDEKRTNRGANDSLPELIRQVKTLAPMYCLGKRLTMGKQGELDVSIIEYEGSLYVSAVNHKNVPLKGAKIKVPRESGQGEVLHEAEKVQIVNHFITSDFKGFEVKVFQFKP